MNKVRQVFEDTVTLLELLENRSGVDREEKIKLIHEYLGKRETEIEGLCPPYSQEEMELGKLLVHLNTKLQTLLEREKLFIQQDMKNLYSKKESNRKYTNPYESLATDGVFYDKRN